MKDFRFDTFQINLANRAALEVCRDIAALEYAGPRPVVLLGAQGAGKSHLLWAIVNQVRASKVQTGLALVLAQEFPEKVRDLVRDPAPIQRGRSAILLVDELERFEENALELEAVVRLFVENNHQVVLASSVDPDRLGAFSAAFRVLLNEGRLVEMQRREAVLQEEPESAGDALAELKYELEALRWERDELQKKLAESGARGSDAAALQEEFEGLRGDRDALEAERGAAAQATKETETLRRQLAEAQAEAEDALAEQARLQGLLSAQKALEEDLRQAEAERDKARGEALRLAKRAEEILDQMQARKTAFSGLQQGLLDKVTRFEGDLAEAGGEHAQPGTPAQDAADRLRRLKQALEETRRELQTRDHAIETLERQKEAEAASAKQRTCELEERVAWLESALGSAVEMGQVTESDLQRFCEDLERSADALRALAVRQAMLKTSVKEEPQAGGTEERAERSPDADNSGIVSADETTDPPSPSNASIEETAAMESSADEEFDARSR